MRRALFAAAVVLAVVVPAGPASAKEPSKASKECIEKLERGGKIDDCHKAPSPILPATNELIWGSIAFVVLFWALYKFAYPPLKQGMENRSNRIRESLDEAEKAKTDAQSILEDYQRQLADAKAESARIIEEARQA